MRRGVVVCLVSVMAGIVACGEGPTAPPPPAGFDPSGDWAYTAQLRYQDVTCNAHGVFSLALSGAAVSGRTLVVATCRGPGGSVTDSGEVIITGGSFGGTSIAFEDDECRYSGRLFSEGRQVKASGSVECDVDVGGPVIHLTGTWRATYVVDVTPPVLAATAVFPAGDTPVVLGDTLVLAVQAADSRRLAFVGYRLGPPASGADSVSVTTRSASLQLRIVVAPAWVGMWPVTVFARDSAGFVAETTLASMRMLDLIRRPTRFLILPAPVYDLAVDPRRNVIYLSYFGRHQIGVVDVASGSHLDPVNTSFPPRSLDLSVGGDSLVASVDSQPALGIVRLDVMPHPMGIVPVDSVPESGTRYVADNVQVLANNKALVSLKYANQYSCCGGYIVEYDLAAGARRVRNDAGSYITTNEPLARSWDRSRMVMITGSTFPERAQTYVAESDSFTPPEMVDVPVAVYPLSADSTGTRFLIANALFDGVLDPVATFIQPEYQQGGATVLSPDGTTVYLATYDGYLKIRVVDGAVLERVRLPFWALQFAITPDGGTLIAVGGTPTYFDPPNNRVLLVSLR